MENSRAQAMSPLISELTQGKELARQLETHLERSSPPELCRSLVQRLRSTWDRAISMAKPPGESEAGAASPRSGSGSPRSDGSDRGLREQGRREMCKKRKTEARRRMRVGAGAGLEALPDDGFGWRKYGQKDILGAKYPRAYYRCTHRHTHGCPATKQVQRSDDSPYVFDVTYLGTHTCAHHDITAAGASTAWAPAAAAEQEDRRPRQQVPVPSPTLGDEFVEPLLLSFRTSLTVNTDDPEPGDPFGSPSFSFPPAPVDGSRTTGGHVLCPPAADQLTGSFSPALVPPPAASEAGRFPTPPSPGSESDLAAMFCIETSRTDSAPVEFGFTMDSVESDPNFPFGASFFS